jgi:site-specific recombinase XerD
MDHIRICINGFYVWLMDNEYIPRNPVKNVPKIKNDTIKEDPFSITELELIRDSCNNLRNRALVEFLLATGCRVSEAVSINKDQIDFESKQFKVIGKGDKTRTIPINDKAILHIKKYINSRIDNTDAMFVTLNKPHRRMTIDAVESMLKTLETKSGVFNIHPHRFRRTLCCILINSGMPITQVAEILGHSSVSTTEIYYSQSMYQIQVNYSKLANF